MHLIAALAAGIAGAEDGTAQIVSRGTSTRAACYSDINGTALTNPSTGIVLDANGGATVYVNELVDVTVLDPNGTTIRDWTEADAAPDVEVRSLSFTGTDYTGGAAATGLPTTLQAVLDGWLTSAGKPDFDVLFNGASSTLQNALGSVAGIFYNVKSPAYGAVGDGATDDTTPIQNAITAAGNAGGGLVWFPAGTYKTTAKLTVPIGVSLWGPGASSTALFLYHATAVHLEYGTGSSTSYQEIRGLNIGAGQSNSGTIVNITNAGSRCVAVFNCIVGNGLNTGSVIAAAAPTTAHRILVSDSKILVMGTAAFGIVAAQSAVTIEVRNSQIVAGQDGFGGTLVSGRNVTLTACELDATACASGTTAYVCVDVYGTAGYGPKGLITGCRFRAGAAGTGYAMYSSYCDESTTSYVESANAIVGTFTGAVYGSLLVSSANRPRIVLGSRDTFINAITSNAATQALSGHIYGMVMLTRSAAGAGAQTLTSVVGPEGARMTVAIYNNSGGALAGAVSFGTGFFAGSPSFNPANGKVSLIEFRVLVLAGGGAWFPMDGGYTTV